MFDDANDEEEKEPMNHDEINKLKSLLSKYF